jgi:hypothetical protein
VDRPFADRSDKVVRTSASCRVRNSSTLRRRSSALFLQREGEVRSPGRKKRFRVVSSQPIPAVDVSAGDGFASMARLGAREMRRLAPDMRQRVYGIARPLRPPPVLRAVPSTRNVRENLRTAAFGRPSEVRMHARREYPVYAEQDPDTEEWTAKIPDVPPILASGRTLEELRRKIEPQLPGLRARLRALSTGPGPRRFSPKVR